MAEAIAAIAATAGVVNAAANLGKLCSSVATRLRNAAADLATLRMRLIQLQTVCSVIAKPLQPDQPQLDLNIRESLQRLLDEGMHILQFVQQHAPSEEHAHSEEAWQIAVNVFAGSKVEMRLEKALAAIGGTLDAIQRAKPLQEAFQLGAEISSTALLTLVNGQYKPPPDIFDEMTTKLAAIIETGSHYSGRNQHRHVILHGPSGIGKSSMTKTVVAFAAEQQQVPVLYASCGSSSGSLAPLRSLVHQLNQKSEPEELVDSLLEKLKHHLPTRSILIADDLQEPALLGNFLKLRGVTIVGSSTKRRTWAQQVGQVEFLPEQNEACASKVLRDEAGGVPHGCEDLAARIVRDWRSCMVAIRMIGAALNGQPTERWHEYQAMFAAQAALPDEPPADYHFPDDTHPANRSIFGLFKWRLNLLLDNALPPMKQELAVAVTMLGMM